MKVTKATLEGVLVIEPPTRFEDFRGEYVELYNEALYRDAGITQAFVQDDISVSTCGVLRGLHGDEGTWKLVSCLSGRFLLAVVNWDPASPNYRKWETFTLSDRNRRQVLIPPKFANGHLVMSESAIFHYKQTTFYDRGSQFTVRWNDPDVGIYWPVKDPILSTRDAGF
ncbi:dTDP-4-keto-6-deoxy-D-glucose epimerase [Azospirillum brasilense]|uniref:dTDP-4-dehydrorhamnose 3,5-epimerase n=1 Tax=Azospirillum brasilense TaxID=192 RepID=A0A6L3AS49_AZOBR|nr:dTDP-4-keto-6-deoxy-D-glucose epimerase [Azospirillum brasilense]